MTPIPTERLEEMRASAQSYIGANGYDPDPAEIISLITELLSSRRADTVEAAEVVKPVAWRCEREKGDWVYYTEYGAAHVHELHAAVVAQPLYDASALASLSSQIEGLKVERDEAVRYATNFLVAYVNRYCSPVASWAPLPDIIGLLTQLDNASTVTADILARAEKAEASLASQAIPEGFVLAPKDLVTQMRELVENALMTYSETQPTEELRMQRMIAPISELNDLLAAIPAAPEVKP